MKKILLTNEELHLYSPLFYSPGAQQVFASHLAANARIRELEAALKPFAEFELTPQDATAPDERCVYATILMSGKHEITVGHFRNARVALEAKE